MEAVRSKLEEHRHPEPLATVAVEAGAHPLVGVVVVDRQTWIDDHDQSLLEPAPGPLLVLAAGHVLAESALPPALDAPSAVHVAEAPERVPAGVVQVLRNRVVHPLAVRVALVAAHARDAPVVQVIDRAREPLGIARIGVRRQRHHELARGGGAAHVERAPVGELCRGHLDHAGAARPRDRHGAVGGPRVDHHDLRARRERLGVEQLERARKRGGLVLRSNEHGGERSGHVRARTRFGVSRPSSIAHSTSRSISATSASLRCPRASLPTDEALL